jgi:hypothetical protein
MGFGLLLILPDDSEIVLNPVIQWVGLFAAIVTLVLWYRFVFSTSSGSLRLATEPLQDTIPLTVTMGVGHLIPLGILLVLLLLVAFDIDFKGMKSIYAMAGTAILLGGGAQKYYIILRANVLREVTAEFCSSRPKP